MQLSKDVENVSREFQRLEQMMDQMDRDMRALTTRSVTLRDDASMSPMSTHRTLTHLTEAQMRLSEARTSFFRAHASAEADIRRERADILWDKPEEASRSSEPVALKVA